MERALHAELKKYYEPNEALHEIPYKGYIADIKNESGIIEIQTASFGRMREKILAFTESDSLTVVYPVIKNKWIVWVDPQTGEATKPRRSPRVGGKYDIFKELVYISNLIGLENLRFKIIEVSVEDSRLKNGWGKGGKRGSERIARQPIEIGCEYTYENVAAFADFVPQSLDREFTVKELASAAKINQRMAGKTVYVLREVGIIEQTGKRGRAYLYRVNDKIAGCN